MAYAGRHFKQFASLTAPQRGGKKGNRQSERTACPQADSGTGGKLTVCYKLDRDLHVMVTADEFVQIQQRMTEESITNAGAYMRKMTLKGYILHVDLATVKEPVSVQRR